MATAMTAAHQIQSQHETYYSSLVFQFSYFWHLLLNLVTERKEVDVSITSMPTDRYTEPTFQVHHWSRHGQ